MVYVTKRLTLLLLTFTSILLPLVTLWHESHRLSGGVTFCSGGERRLCGGVSPSMTMPQAMACGIAVLFLPVYFPEGIPPDLLPQALEILRKGHLVIGVGLVQLIFPGDPGGKVGAVVLDHSLQPVNGLVNLRLQGLPPLHFVVQPGHLPALRLRQGLDPLPQQRLLVPLLLRRFLEGGDVPGEGLPQVVDNAHPHHLVHVQRYSRPPDCPDAWPPAGSRR